MDEFLEKVKALSKRLHGILDTISTEEATKTSIIMPFFQTLGYDVFNPNEFLPEYVADVGIKKGEKVDYAILQNGNPVILIEAKSLNEKLTKHDSQLFRYFGTTSAKFAILTNGITYNFYTDLVEQNKMDSTPFFQFNLLELKENKINELSKFRKENFDITNIMDTASELKYTNEIKQFIMKQWDSPTDDFISFILQDIYQGRKTQNVIDKFRDLVKKSLKQFLNELVNDKLQAALNNTNSNAVEEATSDQTNISEVEVAATEHQVETTNEEIEGYAITKMLLKNVVDGNRILYRDNKSYFNILLDDSIRKWICRLGLNGAKKYIQLNDDKKTVHYIDSVMDIEKYKNELKEIVEKYL